MHILSTLNTSVFQTVSHWGTRRYSDFCTLAFCLSPDSCSWLTWIGLKPWLSFMLEEFCSFDPERGRRSSARRQDALPHICARYQRGSSPLCRRHSCFHVKAPFWDWPWIWWACRGAEGGYWCRLKLCFLRYSSPGAPLSSEPQVAFWQVVGE